MEMHFPAGTEGWNNPVGTSRANCTENRAFKCNFVYFRVSRRRKPPLFVNAALIATWLAIKMQREIAQQWRRYFLTFFKVKLTFGICFSSTWSLSINNQIIFVNFLRVFDCEYVNTVYDMIVCGTFIVYVLHSRIFYSAIEVTYYTTITGLYESNRSVQ